MNRVVLTGMGVVTHYGEGIDKMMRGLQSRPLTPEPVQIPTFKDKFTTLPHYEVPKEVYKEFEKTCPDKIYRILVPMSAYACIATDEAISLEHRESFHSMSGVGVSVASSAPSIESLVESLNLWKENPKKITSGHVFKTLHNVITLTLAKYVGADSRVSSLTNACASSIHNAIFGYESIALGKAKVMLCGGTEEYDPYLTFMFMKLSLASSHGCKPFHKNRDGIIIGDGAGMLQLEEYYHAKNRNVPIYAEVVGAEMTFSAHTTFNDKDDIFKCMYRTVYNIPYGTVVINTHATGTESGDLQELEAIQTLKRACPQLKFIVTALKRYFGHTLAASGAIETIATIKLIEQNKLIPLAEDDSQLVPELQNQDYNIDRSRPIYFLKNSFSLGGANSSILFKIQE